MSYKVSSVRNLSDLSPGAHVRVVRGRTAGLARGLYDHHMLVTAVISASIVRVIHYTAPAAEGTDGTVSASASSFWFGGDGEGVAGIIAEEEINMEPEDLELLQYQDGVAKFSGDEAIQRARQRLHEKDYGLFSNNCECLVNWALRGEAVSYQAVDGAVASSRGAIAGAMQSYREQGTVTSAFLGALGGLVSGYVDHREKRQ